MNQLNILLIYSYEKAKKQLTAFLQENGFTAIESFHEIEVINAIQFYPDIAIIQTAIDCYQKNTLKVNKQFPSLETFYWNMHSRRTLQSEELKEILEAKRLLKRQRLISCIKQIQQKPYSQNINKNGNEFYKLDLTHEEAY